MTDRMSEEKARERVEAGNTFKLEKDKPYNLGAILQMSETTAAEFYFASGYLQALEDERKRAEGLVNDLRSLLVHTDKDGDMADFAVHCFVKRILSQYNAKEGK